ncbi:MAG: hypothetical protein ACE5Z5_01320 [Candidatus Bathyarchaeia archaeon]
MRALVEMSYRERILTTLRGERADRLPFFHYWRHSQRGRVWREVRNRGMGLGWSRPSYTSSMPHVEIVERRDTSTGEATHFIEYHTPVGVVTERVKQEAGTGQWHAQRSWRDVSPWVVDRKIRSPEDYDVVRFMVEDTVYRPYYFPIEQAKEWVGDDGFVITSTGHTPMQMLMIDWVGSGGGRFYIHHARYREKVEELYEALVRKYMEKVEIAADSPADMVLVGDNIDGVLVDPRLFERYFMPVYEECGEVLHGRGKIMATHMDGRLGILKDLIAKCPQDVIEALHPPPMGDLPIAEALSLWGDKVIMMAYPGSVYTMGPGAVKGHLLELLRSVVPGDRLIICASSENLVSNENLLMLASVLEDATLPLTKQGIDEIERALP